MKNVCLILEYLGTNYCGFQKQKNGLSIQEVLEKALEKLTGKKITVYPSGRTDAGVHALGQVCNFFDDSQIPAEKFVILLNQNLPFDIRVKESFEVDANFHSRKSAKSKTYIYKLFLGENFSVFDAHRVLPIKYNLDIEKMNECCRELIGKHDFSSFCCKHTSTKTTIRTIFDAKFVKENDYLTFEVTGNGFLYNMVRILVGTLIEVGRGKLSKEDFVSLLNTNNRAKAGKTVKPDGLYLKQVKY